MHHTPEVDKAHMRFSHHSPGGQGADMKVYRYSIRAFRATQNHSEKQFGIQNQILLQRLRSKMATVYHVANDQRVLQTEHE